MHIYPNKPNNERSIYKLTERARSREIHHTCLIIQIQIRLPNKEIHLNFGINTSKFKKGNIHIQHTPKATLLNKPTIQKM